MKKLLVAGIAAAAFCSAPALAADLPTKAPVYRPAPVALFNWTGCYFGANTGYAWASKSGTLTIFDGDPSGDPLGSLTANGWAYGGQIGCDYQFNNNWVVGIRGMLDGSSMKGSNHLTATPDLSGDTSTIKVGSFGTVVAKLGYLLNPTLELYGLAGVAWVRDKYTWTDPELGAFASANQTRTGYDVGVGISWMFARNWELWLEYDYMGFGTKNVTLNGEGLTAGEIFGSDVKQSVSKVLVGIDFRFPDLVGKAPVVAKY